MAGETLEGIYVVQQLRPGGAGLGGRRRLGDDELPLLRLLIRVVTECARADTFENLFGKLPCRQHRLPASAGELDRG